MFTNENRENYYVRIRKPRKTIGLGELTCALTAPKWLVHNLSTLMTMIID